MIADLRPYAEYKESGLPWLGQVPVEWSIGRIKTVLRELDCRSIDGDGTLLSLTRVRGLIPHADRTDKIHSAKTLVRYKRYEPGHIVMNRMQAWSGMFGAGGIEGLVSPDYAVFKIIGGHQTKFLLERLKTPDLVGQFALESKGIGSGFNRLYTDRFGSIPIAFPPPAEQAAIVRFLDWATGRLERTIRAKRKVIALLGEQKQATIHRAVTRGLDPSVPRKPSGIPWLGDIPRTYKRTRLGRVCLSIRDGTHNPPPAVPGVHRLLSVRNIIGGRFVTRPDDRTMTPTAYSELQRSYRVQTGDIVIALVGATTGKSAVVESMENVTVQRSLGILRPNLSLVRSEFLNLLISCTLIQDQIHRIMGKYAAQPGIYLEELGGIQVIFPNVEDQVSIVAYVQRETAPIATAISRLEREIELLREYRIRLVADAVTGKLDVREAALHLPDEEPPDTVEDDDSELYTDLDASDEEAPV